MAKRAVTMGNSPTEQEQQSPGGSSRRRFRLVDGMVLVVVAAVMLSARGLFLWLWANGLPDASYGDREVTRLSIGLALVGLSFVLLPFLLARPLDRRRLRQGAPGLVVHLVVAVTLAWMLVEWVIRCLVSVLIWKDTLHNPTLHGLFYIVIQMGMPISIGVAIAWTTLAIVGRWRPDRGWDDRLGRLVGCLWFVYGPGESLIHALMPH
jgi:hypothetical protein